jgi:hypothetical protein
MNGNWISIAVHKTYFTEIAMNRYIMIWEKHHSAWKNDNLSDVKGAYKIRQSDRKNTLVHFV